MDSPHFIIIPGLAEAQAEESAAREHAFLPVRETICGIEVDGFAPLHFTILDAAQSPFVRGGLPTALDVAVFLWVVSPCYAPQNRFDRWRFLRRVRGVDYAAAVKAIRNYVDASLSDSPGGGGEPRIAYWSAMAGLVDLIASEYHWSEEQIMRTPFRRLMQYARCIRARHDDKAVFFNPRSDAVIAEFQRTESARRLAEQSAKN